MNFKGENKMENVIEVVDKQELLFQSLLNYSKMLRQAKEKVRMIQQNYDDTSEQIQDLFRAKG